MLKDQRLLMRRNSMTPAEREQMASLNTRFHGAILDLVADFTKSEKGSIRPFLLTIGKGHAARNNYFTSLDQLSDFAEKRIAKETHILSEIDKMYVMLKMYDRSDYYVIIRQQRKGMRPYNVRVFDKPQDKTRATSGFGYFDNSKQHVFDSLETLWKFIHNEIAKERDRIEAIAQAEANA